MPLMIVFVWMMILEGDIIYRITSLYPDKYKEYVWFFGQRLKIIYFIRQVKNKQIVDEILIGYYKKIVIIWAVGISIWALFMLSILIGN